VTASVRYALLGGFILLVAGVVELMRDQSGYFKSRQGTLVNDTQPRVNGPALENIVLVSSSGLEVAMRVRLPPEAMTQKVPLILLIGGYRTGKHAVDLVKDPRGLAYAAIDYPYDGTLSPRSALDKAIMFRDVQNAFIDTPPALMLAMDWLEKQAWLDQDHTHLLGVSLGVPFAAAAAAVDERFKHVWLIHGAAKNTDWLDHALSRQIESDWLRAAAAHAGIFLMYGNAFDTLERVSDIAPRPVTLISAREDERVPEQSKDLLQAAAQREHVTHIWSEGRHIGPRRQRELNQLLKLVTDKVIAGANPITHQ